MKTLDEIQLMLEVSVNTLLGQHRGRVDVHSRDNDHIYVKMSGGCRGCAGAKYTLNMMITKAIREFDPTVNVVSDVTDHKDKTDAYYKE